MKRKKWRKQFIVLMLAGLMISGQSVYATEPLSNDARQSEFVDQYALLLFDEKETDPDSSCENHTWDAGTITKEATARTDGEMTYTCTTCGETKIEIIPAIGFPDGWNKIDNSWYYYKANNAQTGWQKVGGTWYYFSGSGAMVTGWLKSGNTWYYMNTSGSMATGWAKVDNTWYYMNSSGAMQTGWQKIGNTWYYFSGSGAMVTGWLKSGNTWYYMNSSGSMATGWAKVGNTWYYMNSSGAMQTGWQKIGNTWYYFSGSGAMVTGWLKVGNTWYYMNSSGAMATGWAKVNGAWYYMESNGAMVAADKTINGTLYYFLSSGRYIGRKYPSLNSVGINYGNTVNTKVDNAMRKMFEMCAEAGFTFEETSKLDQAAIIIQYIGLNYDYGDGSYKAESMLDKGYGTCFAYSDLTLCFARKAGISSAQLTVPGKNVDHDGYYYGSLHRTVVAKIDGSWYDLDANGMASRLPMLYQYMQMGFEVSEEDFLPEKISESYANYLLGNSNTYSSIH